MCLFKEGNVDINKVFVVIFGIDNPRFRGWFDSHLSTYTMYSLCNVLQFQWKTSFGGVLPGSATELEKEPLTALHVQGRG